MGSWSRLDHAIWRHPKVAGMPETSVLVYLRSICWSGDYLTDGWIPADALPQLCTSQTIGDPTIDLMDAGLWDPDDGGYWIHDYTDYQPTREQVLARRDDPDARRRRMDRERQRRHRARKRAELDARGPVDNPVDNPGDNSLTGQPCHDSVTIVSRKVSRSRNVTPSPVDNSGRSTATWDPGDKKPVTLSRTRIRTHNPSATSPPTTYSGGAGLDDDGSGAGSGERLSTTPADLVARAATIIGTEAHDRAVARGGVTKPDAHRRACVRSAHVEHAEHMRAIAAKHPDITADVLADVIMGRRTPDGGRFIPGVGRVDS